MSINSNPSSQAITITARGNSRAGGIRHDRSYASSANSSGDQPLLNNKALLLKAAIAARLI